MEGLLYGAVESTSDMFEFSDKKRVPACLDVRS